MLLLVEVGKDVDDMGIGLEGGRMFVSILLFCSNCGFRNEYCVCGIVCELGIWIGLKFVFANLLVNLRFVAVFIFWIVDCVCFIVFMVGWKDDMDVKFWGWDGGSFEGMVLKGESLNGFLKDCNYKS